jgi:hypothetical protein
MKIQPNQGESNQIQPNPASEEFFPEKYFLPSQLGWIEDPAPLKIIQKSGRSASPTPMPTIPSTKSACSSQV